MNGVNGVIAPQDTMVQAAQMVRDGKTLGQVAARLDISTESARGMIQSGKQILDQRARSAPKPDTDRELLRWAREVESPLRARQLAERILAMLRELRSAKEKHDAAADIRVRLADAEEKVATYRAELKRIQSGHPEPATAKPGATSGADRLKARAESQVIRDWARVNGFPNIGVAGVIAKPVLDAYEAFRQATS